MKIVVSTENGTTFRIDPKMQFYERLEGTPETRLKRTAFGFYEHIGWETYDTGLHLALTCEAAVPGGPSTHFHSTAVRKIEAA